MFRNQDDVSPLPHQQTRGNRQVRPFRIILPKSQLLDGHTFPGKVILYIP